MPSLFIEEDLPLQGVLNRADALDADLLVIGSRGEHYLSRLLLGTTAESLLRLTSRPCLIVKGEPAGAYRKVLVPVDFSSWSIRSLQMALQVAPGAEIILLHAYEAPFEQELRFAGVKEETLTRHIIAAQDDARMQLRELTAGITEARDAHIQLKVIHGDASYVVPDHARDNDCDLVVMGKHGKGVIEELLLGSVTKHVLGESPVDVLVIC
jgi:nucleotide-binding universal stress UspA family protein